MHAHERTFMSKNSHFDPDRGDRRHDLACQYLALPDVRQRLGESLIQSILEIRSHDSEDPGRKGSGRQDLTRIGSGRFEVHVAKGERQYRTTIGFIDLILPYTYSKSFRAGGQPCDGEIIFEVKISPAEMGDLLRQLRVYQEYYQSGSRGSDIWVCATAYPISPSDYEMLQSADVYHVQLGEAFQEWCQKQQINDQEMLRSIVL